MKNGSTPTSAYTQPLPREWILLALGARLALGLLFVFTLEPLSLDDSFRIHHAIWWWNNPSFTGSLVWLPGHAYFYGVIVGLFNNSVLIPRLATLALSMLTAMIILLAPLGLSNRSRLIAFFLVLFSPLSVLLGTVPLTETLFALLLVSSFIAFEIFRRDRHLPWLLACSALVTAASAVRYEAWVLLPLMSSLILMDRPRGGIKGALALLPWIFPLTWFLLLWGLQGQPFTFLTGVADDHHGAGNLLSELTSYATWPIPIHALGAIFSSLWLLVRGQRDPDGNRQTAPIALSLGLATIILGLTVGVILLTGNTPSQFPIRLLYPPIILGSIPLGHFIDDRLSQLQQRTKNSFPASPALGALFIITGMFYALTLDSGVPQNDHLAGLFVEQALENEQLLAGKGHVLIERILPNSTTVLVYANRPNRVHIDGLGSSCPTGLLLEWAPDCPPPAWTDKVKMAIVTTPQAGDKLVKEFWIPISQIGPWQIFLR